LHGVKACSYHAAAAVHVLAARDLHTHGHGPLWPVIYTPGVSVQTKCAVMTVIWSWSDHTGPSLAARGAHTDGLAARGAHTGPSLAARGDHTHRQPGITHVVHTHRQPGITHVVHTHRQLGPKSWT